MRKYIGLFIIMGWFFTTEMVYEGDAKTRSIIGPFKTEALCDKEMDYARNKIAELGWEVKLGKKCYYIQEV